MNEHSRQWSEELGAYLVGALEPEEAERMRRHLDECAECQAEHAQLAPVVGVLAMIPAEALAGDESLPAEPPDEAMWERLRARAGFEPGPGAASAASPVRGDLRRAPLPSQRPPAPGAERPRRRSRRPMRPATAAAVSGVLVAAAAAGVFVGVHNNDNGSESGVAGTETVSAANVSDGVSGSVQYGPTDWGSWVQITLKGVKPGDDCVLYAMDRSGGKAVASTWWAPPTLGESATVPGGVSMQSADITTFQVTDSVGNVLLTIPAS